MSGGAGKGNAVSEGDTQRYRRALLRAWKSRRWRDGGMKRQKFSRDAGREPAEVRGFLALESANAMQLRYTVHPYGTGAHARNPGKPHSDPLGLQLHRFAQDL